MSFVHSKVLWTWLSLRHPGVTSSRLPSGASPASRQEPPGQSGPLGSRTTGSGPPLRHRSPEPGSVPVFQELLVSRWSEETPHSLMPVAGSALPFGALPSAGLRSETKASSIKADLPSHTFRDEFFPLLLVLKSGRGLIPLKIMERTNTSQMRTRLQLKETPIPIIS